MNKILVKSKVISAKKGSQKACNWLIDKFYKQVYWYALGLTKDVDQAQDLTQETFIKVWKSIDNFRMKSSFKTWIFAILRNTFLEMKRKQRLEFVEIDKERLIQNNGFKQNCKDEVVSIVSDGVLYESVNVLPLIYREIITLHYFEDMKYKEISKVLAIPLGTVKSRIWKAMKLLREIIGRNHEKNEIK